MQRDLTLLEVLQSFAEHWAKSSNIVNVQQEARTLGKVAVLMKNAEVAACCHRWRTYPETNTLGGPYTPDITTDITKWLAKQGAAQTADTLPQA